MSSDLAEMVRAAVARAEALELFREGAPPSACDRRCGLDPGTTHDEVVLGWAADREARRRALFLLEPVLWLG